MTTQDRQLTDGAPTVADATQRSTETVQEPCPADDCDSDRADYEMMPKPGGSLGSAVHLRRVRPQVARVLMAHRTTHREQISSRHIASNLTDTSSVLAWPTADVRGPRRRRPYHHIEAVRSFVRGSTIRISEYALLSHDPVLLPERSVHRSSRAEITR